MAAPRAGSDPGFSVGDVGDSVGETRRIFTGNKKMTWNCFQILLLTVERETGFKPARRIGLKS